MFTNLLLTVLGGSTFFYSFQSVKENNGNNDSLRQNEESTLKENFVHDPLQLGNSTVPESYELYTKAFLPGYVKFPPEKDFLFEAKVKIRIRVNSETSFITLNSVGLTLNSSRLFKVVDNKVSSEIGISKVRNLVDLERIQFTTKEMLQKGDLLELQIRYQGQLKDDSGGFYRTKYASANGDEKIAAVTNFAPIYARKMVPCYDEMAMKATWKVEVAHPRGTTAVSNQEVERKSTDIEDGSFYLTRFKTTPKMSSYLLVTMISEFVRVNHTTSKTDFGVWSRPESTPMTKFALKNAVQCTRFYEDYFDIKYPLEKLDMAAIPDLIFGAMENWGLITYKETTMLYDPKLCSISDRLKVSSTISHELAHQWFGNLVTAKWWNDIWLNEGFATFVQHLGSDAVSDGKYKMMDFFLTSARRKALEIDDKTSSHPLSRRISKKSEILGIYDTLSYQKGASILALIRDLMGAEAFQNGLRSYLKEYSYGNAEAMDLLRALDHAVPQNVTGPDGKRLNISAFAPQWIFQMGYPFVTLNRINTTTIHIDQEVYLLGGNSTDLEPSTFGYKWDIPLWIQKGTSSPELHWLTRDGPLEFSSSEPEVTILNADAFSFMRQNYALNDWQLIADQLLNDHSIFSNRTRFGIISDAFAMAKIDVIDYNLLFRVTKYMAREKNYLPWFAFDNGFTRIQQNLINTEIEDDSKKFYAKILEPHYSEDLPDIIANNYLNDDKIYDVLRDTLIYLKYCEQTDNCSRIGEIYEEQVEAPCSNLTKAVASSCSRVAPPIRSAVYCYAVQNDEDRFEEILSFYERESVVIEKNRLLAALACSSNSTALIGLLRTAINRKSTLIRLQDIGTVFNNIATSKYGSSLVFQFLIDNWGELYETFSTQHIVLNDIVNSCLFQIKTEEELEKLEIFMAGASHVSDYAAFSQQLQNGRQAVKWLKENAETLRKIFENSVSD